VRSLLTWLLLVIVPLSGIRMVCIDRPLMAPSTAAGDCDQFCLRANAPEREVGTTDVDCVLFAQCSLLVGVSSVAVLPVQSSIAFELGPHSDTIEVTHRYLAPILSHRTPPPKA
jgi:hypothetical protein